MSSIVQKKGLTRNSATQLDKFYTSKDTVNFCITIWKNVEKYLNFTSSDIIIEPSAGNGAWIEGIKSLGNEVSIFLDIEPEHPEISKMDYIDFDYNPYTKNSIHIIGNPPFGRQSCLANKFIKKSAQFATSISFILPKSFKKDSMQKAFPLNYHLVCEEDIPTNSFLVNGKEHDVPCIFQIWVKKDSNRIVKEKLEPVNFSFVSSASKQEAHISFRRVGVNAGKVSIDDISSKSEQSHYFIRLDDESELKSLVQKLNSINFCGANDTVGPKSISKQELIEKFNGVLI